MLNVEEDAFTLEAIFSIHKAFTVCHELIAIGSPFRESDKPRFRGIAASEDSFEPRRVNRVCID